MGETQIIWELKATLCDPRHLHIVNSAFSLGQVEEFIFNQEQSETMCWGLIDNKCEVPSVWAAGIFNSMCFIYLCNLIKTNKQTKTRNMLAPSPCFIKRSALRLVSLLHSLLGVCNRKQRPEGPLWTTHWTGSVYCKHTGRGITEVMCECWVWAWRLLSQR